MAILNVAMTAIKVISKMSAKKAVSGGAKKFITNKAKEKVKGKIKDKFLGKKDKKEKGGAAIRPSSAIMVSGSTPLLPSTSASNPFDSKSDKSSSIIKKPTEKVNFEKLTESINNIVRITEDLNDASKKQLENDKDILEDERKRRQKAARKRRESLLESGKKVAGSAVKGAAAVGEKFDLMKFFENILLGGAFLAIMNLLSGNQKTLDNLSQNIFRIYKVLPRLLKFLFDPLGLFEGAFKLIKKLLSPLTNTIKNAVSNLTNKVKEVFEKGFKKLGTAITEFIDDLGKKLTKAFNEGLEQAAKQADEIIKAALKQSDAILKAAKEQAERLVREATENLIKPGKEALEQGAKSLFDKLPKFAQQGLTKAGQGAQQLARNVQTGASNVVEFGKNLGKRFINAVDGVKNSVSKFGSSVVEGAQNVGKRITGFAANQADKALEFLQEKIKPTIQEILEKNPLLKKISTFVTNPKKAGNRILNFVGDGVQQAAKNPRLLDTLGTLKKARSAAGSQLGPLDKIITVIESVVRYGMGEAPVNAIALALANLFGYAAGFAAASVIPGLGQSGIFNMLGGIAGSEIAEAITEIGLSKLLQAVPELGQIEDPISKRNPDFQKRPLLRDPYMSFEDYRKSINMEGGKFLGMDIPNLLGGASENTSQTSQSSGNDIPQVAPQERMMGGSSKSSPIMLSGDSKKIIGDDHEFLEKVKKLSAKYQIHPADLLGKIASESGFNPAADNGTHVGLIQFSRDSASAVGTTQAALKKMTRAQQMDYVEKYFDYWKLPKGATAGHLYTVTFLPAFVKESADYVLAKKGGFTDKNGYHPSSWYDHNAGLDVDGDGQITIGDLGQRIQKKKKEYGISGGETGNYVSRGQSEQSDMTDTPPVLERGTGTNSEVTTTTNQQLDQPRSEEYASGSMDASPVSTPDLSTPGSSGGGDPQSAQLSQPRSEEYASGGGSGGGGVSTAGQSTAQSLSRRASYEQGADQDLVIPLPQQQNGGGGMIRSKSRVMMMGGDSLDRYYKAQLLGSLYKRG